VAWNSDYNYGLKYANRKGIHGGPLHRQINGWIEHYNKLVEQGDFCPIRGAKIIAKFQKMLAKKEKAMRTRAHFR
jgi:hypothetical protein